MQPYRPQGLPPTDINWEQVIPQMSAAIQAIARYDGMLGALHNPEVLLSPMTTQEAVQSSRIEGTVATLSDVLEFEAGEDQQQASRAEDIREILNYRNAMRYAVMALADQPVTLKIIKNIHSLLLDSVRGRNKRRGEFRTIQNWIGPKDCQIEDAFFVPPSPLDLQGYLSEFEIFINTPQIDHLVHGALIHAQFELLHPFLDGNGRLGRLLIPLTFHKAGVLSSPMFYISGYLEQHRDEYYNRLQELSENQAWTEWLIFFLTAVETQARTNLGYVRATLDLYEETKATVSARARSQYSIQAIDTIFKRPIFTIPDFEKESRIPKSTAIRIVNILEELKVVDQVRAARGRRPALYSFYQLLHIADGDR